MYSQVPVDTGFAGWLELLLSEISLLFFSLFFRTQNNRITTRRDIEVVITRRSWKPFAFTGAWVRIPLPPPLQGAIKPITTGFIAPFVFSRIFFAFQFFRSKTAQNDVFQREWEKSEVRYPFPHKGLSGLPLRKERKIGHHFTFSTGFRRFLLVFQALRPWDLPTQLLRNNRGVRRCSRLLISKILTCFVPTTRVVRI